MNIDGKNAVVTGGASGIGKAIAQGLVNRGCQVVVADIDTQTLERTISELGELAHGIVCNVRDVVAVDQLVDNSWEKLGSVDLVFANAGVMGNGPMKASIFMK